MGRRDLSVIEITDELLSECEVTRGGALSLNYQCSDASAVLVPVQRVRTLPRGMNRDAILSILRGFHDGAALPPIDIFDETEPPATHLLHGRHRLQASSVFGFKMIPCKVWDRDSAGLLFKYPAGIQPL